MVVIAVVERVGKLEKKWDLRSVAVMVEKMVGMSEM